MLEHLPGLVALTCPSANSYRRLIPNSWSSAFVCYRPDNREAAIRIPSTFRGNEMVSANLEAEREVREGKIDEVLKLAEKEYSLLQDARETEDKSE